MKILITGSSGAVGTHLSKRLIDDGYDVVGFDIKKPDVIPDGMTFTEGNVVNFNFLGAAAVGCDVGIHLAVLDGDTNPKDILATNILGTFGFLQAAKHAHFKHAIIASSAPVHLEPGDLDNQYLLRTSEGEDYVYDLSKALQEVIGHDFHGHGLPVLCLRFGHIVCGAKELDLNRVIPLKDIEYCRGGWVALEDVVEACTAAIEITLHTEQLEILNVVGGRGARNRFQVAETERRLGIRFRYDFAEYE